MRVFGVGVLWTDTNRAKKAREVAEYDLIAENRDYRDEMRWCIDMGVLGHFPKAIYIQAWSTRHGGVGWFQGETFQ
jgi:hypothetical protein